VGEKKSFFLWETSPSFWSSQAVSGYWQTPSYQVDGISATWTD